MKDPEALLVLGREIENDVLALERIAERLRVPPERVASLASSDPVVAAVAFEIHNYYSVCENLMRRVAMAFENALDRSAWHRQLLARMALDIPGVRPALIVPEVRDRLDELRRFRHFFRNAYDRPLDPKKVAANLELTQATHGPWLGSIRGFLSWLGELSGRLGSEPGL